MDVAQWCYMWDGLCWVEYPGCKLVRTSRCSYKKMFDHDLTLLRVAPLAVSKGWGWVGVGADPPCSSSTEHVGLAFLGGD